MSKQTILILEEYDNGTKVLIDSAKIISVVAESLEDLFKDYLNMLQMKQEYENLIK
jgi:hypothetical protein